jgi:hypothetical protein
MPIRKSKQAEQPAVSPPEQRGQPPDQDQDQDQDQYHWPQESLEANIYQMVTELYPRIGTAALAQALVNSVLKFARPTPEWRRQLAGAVRRLVDWLAETGNSKADS